MLTLRRRQEHTLEWKIYTVRLFGRDMKRDDKALWAVYIQIPMRIGICEFVGANQESGSERDTMLFLWAKISYNYCDISMADLTFNAS